LGKLLTSTNSDDRQFAQTLVRDGRCFVVASLDGFQIFGPSRFVGDRGNSRTKHKANRGKDSRETNPVLTRILGKNLIADRKLEKEYRRFCDRVGVKYKDLVGKKIQRKYWSNAMGSNTNGNAQAASGGVHSTTAPLAYDLEAPPAGRVKTTISRIIRDTQLANRVKVLHDYECQICGETMVLHDGSRYAEGHHIRPLGSPHDGPDVVENIICLCPNHHAACDLGAILLVDLRTRREHHIGQQYIDYHNQKLYRGSYHA
jgi:hypothetical protein